MQPDRGDGVTEEFNAAPRTPENVMSNSAGVYEQDAQGVPGVIDTLPALAGAPSVLSPSLGDTAALASLQAPLASRPFHLPFLERSGAITKDITHPSQKGTGGDIPGAYPQGLPPSMASSLADEPSLSSVSRDSAGFKGTEMPDTSLGVIEDSHAAAGDVIAQDSQGQLM